MTLGSIIVPQASFARPYVGTQEMICYRDEYTETYIPGTRDNPGYVRIDVETVEYPCRRRLDTTNVRPYNPNEPDYVPTGQVDDNSCIEGTIVGGVLGAALAGGMSEPDSMIWSIPVGAVGGALVGCQIDGG